MNLIGGPPACIFDKDTVVFMHLRVSKRAHTYEATNKTRAEHRLFGITCHDRLPH